MEIQAAELSSSIKDFYASNRQLLWLNGDETYRYQTAIEEGVTAFNKETDGKVRVICHDKASGFYEGTPPVLLSNAVQTVPGIALRCIVGDRKAIASIPDVTIEDLGYEPQENLVFILKDWEFELNNNPDAIQLLRNIVQNNMCSSNYYARKQGEKVLPSTRGKRMVILITPTQQIPMNLPEIKPITVALPDEKTLLMVVNSVCDTQEKRFEQTKTAKNANDRKGLPKSAPDVRRNLAKALAGLDYLRAEDSLALAITRYRDQTLTAKWTETLEVIEQEKSSFVAGIPGLHYVDKRLLAKVGDLPGYEAFIDFVMDRVNIDAELAAAHNMQPLRGVTLAGAPGTGKTTAAMMLAALTGRMLLIWNLGESQGSLVGESEATTRRATQVIQTTGAVALIDDADKGGMSVASGGSSTSVEGGPFGRMIQTLLTEMSRPDNRAIWCFTGNRIKNIPGELIRPGRVDERFYVQRPDAKTRPSILKVHFGKYNFPIESKADEEMIELIGSDLTEEWTGAELQSLALRAVIKALNTSAKKIDWKWTCNMAKTTKPMAKQAAYEKDILDMEESCNDWAKIGRSPTVEDSKRGRAERSIA